MNFTPAAVSYIEKMIEKDKGIGFRLSVKKTGCSGYTYLPTIVEKAMPADQVLIIKADDSQADVKIFIDTAWLDLLADLHVDYVEEDKLGLKQKRLVFTNPKEGNLADAARVFR